MRLRRLATAIASTTIGAASLGLAGCCGTYGTAYDPCQPAVCMIQPMPPCPPALDPCLYADPCLTPTYVAPPPCPPPPCPPGSTYPTYPAAPPPAAYPTAPSTTYPAMPPPRGAPSGTGPVPPEPRPDHP